MTLIRLICDLKWIKTSQQKHSAAVVRACCRRHPDTFLVVVSFLPSTQCAVCRAVGVRRDAALRCRLGTHPSCLGSADCQIIPHSSPCSVFIADTFLSPPTSLLWKTLRILYTFRFNTSLFADTLGNLKFSQVFHLQSWESLLDCSLIFL